MQAKNNRRSRLVFPLESAPLLPPQLTRLALACVIISAYAAIRRAIRQVWSNEANESATAAGSIWDWAIYSAYLIPTISIDRPLLP